MAIFYLIFSAGFRLGGNGFLVFLLIGLTLWKWFQSTVTRGATIIVASRGLLSQTYFPKYVLVLITILAGLLKFLIVFGVLLGFVHVMGYEYHYTWLHLPVLVLVMLAIIVAFTSISAAITPFFPDYGIILNNVMLLLFVMSGVFYDISERSEEIQQILYLNPLALLLREFRVILLDHNLPDYVALAWIMMACAVVTVCGFLALVKFDRAAAKAVI